MLFTLSLHDIDDYAAPPFRVYYSAITLRYVAVIAITVFFFSAFVSPLADARQAIDY